MTALEIAIAIIIVFLGLLCALMICSDILAWHNRKNAKKAKTYIVSKEQLHDLMEMIEKEHNNDSD